MSRSTKHSQCIVTLEETLLISQLCITQFVTWASQMKKALCSMLGTNLTHWTLTHFIDIGISHWLKLNIVIPVEFSSLLIQERVMRRGWREKTHIAGGGWDSRGREMEIMGVVFSTHELKGGSLGSCAAEECCWGWEAFFVDLVSHYVDTNMNLFFGLLLPKVSHFSVWTTRGVGLLTWCWGYWVIAWLQR